MSKRTNRLKNLPLVSEATMRAITYDQQKDAASQLRVFSFHNNRNNELMRHIVSAANYQAEGDIDRQTSFINGASYVLAALQRQLDTDQLLELLQHEDICTGTTKSKKIEN